MYLGNPVNFSLNGSAPEYDSHAFATRGVVSSRPSVEPAPKL